MVKSQNYIQLNKKMHIFTYPYKHFTIFDTLGWHRKTQALQLPYLSAFIYHLRPSY